MFIVQILCPRSRLWIEKVLEKLERNSVPYFFTTVLSTCCFFSTICGFVLYAYRNAKVLK